MLPTSLVQEIDRLLKESRLSHRQIALRLGVSRATISDIARGRRGLHGRDPKATQTLHTPTSAPVRCQGCGYRVYAPCLVCQARNYRRTKRASA